MDEQADILREQAGGHRIFGASKWHRILSCTGSLRAEFGLPDTARYEAAEGTVAHEIGDIWLRTGKAPRHRLGEIVTMKLATGTYQIPIEEVMFTHVAEHVKRCQAEPGDHYFEQFVDYSELTPIPDQGGTADHFVCRPRHVTVDDLKYGVADQIFARNNPQAQGYALGVIFKWDWLYSFETVTIRINQPRLDHFDVWETTVAELMEFADYAKSRMYEAWEPNAPRTPSEKACRYCKAKLQCVEAGSLMDRLIDETFSDERELDPAVPAVWTESPPASISPQWEIQPTAKLANLLQYRKLFEKLFQDAQDELARRILRGEQVEGWFVAEGKNRRHVDNRNGVLEALRTLGLSPSRAFETKFLSPAKLEGVLVHEGLSLGAARKFLAPFVRTIPGDPVVSQVKPGKRAALDLADDSFVDESVEL